METKTVQKIDEDQPDLEGATAIATVALRKSWAKKATYWVTLFKVPVAATSIWVVMKSWKFPRGTEVVQGSSEAYRGGGIVYAIESIQEVVEDKVQGGADYLVNHFSTAEDIPADESATLNSLTNYLDSMCRTAAAGPTRKPEPAKSEESVSEFAEAMKRRKKGAYW